MLPCFDYGFIGEAEYSLPQFLTNFDAEKRNNRLKVKTKGVMFRDGDQIRSQGEEWISLKSTKRGDLGVREILDEIPIPARHLLPMEKYFWQQ